jgi:hypothetical protein
VQVEVGEVTPSGRVKSASIKVRQLTRKSGTGETVLLAPGVVVAARRLGRNLIFRAQGRKLSDEVATPSPLELRTKVEVSAGSFKLLDKDVHVSFKLSDTETRVRPQEPSQFDGQDDRDTVIDYSGRTGTADSGSVTVLVRTITHRDFWALSRQPAGRLLRLPPRTSPCSSAGPAWPAHGSR